MAAIAPLGRSRATSQPPARVSPSPPVCSRCRATHGRRTSPARRQSAPISSSENRRTRCGPAEERGQDRRGRPAAGPVFDPRLQYTPEKNSSASDGPQESQKGRQLQRVQAGPGARPPAGNRASRPPEGNRDSAARQSASLSSRQEPKPLSLTRRSTSSTITASDQSVIRRVWKVRPLNGWGREAFVPADFHGHHHDHESNVHHRFAGSTRYQKPMPRARAVSLASHELERDRTATGGQVGQQRRGHQEAGMARPRSVRVGAGRLEPDRMDIPQGRRPASALPPSWNAFDSRVHHARHAQRDPADQ